MSQRNSEPVAVASVVSDVSFVAVDGDKIATMAAKEVAASQIVTLTEQAKHLTRVSEDLLREKHALDMKQAQRESERREAEWQAKYPEAAAEERKAKHEKQLYDMQVAMHKKAIEAEIKMKEEESKADVQLMMAPLYEQNFKGNLALAGYTFIGIGAAFLYGSKM